MSNHPVNGDPEDDALWARVRVIEFPNSFLGMEGPYGAIKVGKSDTPYKRATSIFDPFSATVADYNSIMGNTGGDNRAEFDWRAEGLICRLSVPLASDIVAQAHNSRAASGNRLS